jgi:uncharacterized protein YggE
VLPRVFLGLTLAALLAMPSIATAQTIPVQPAPDTGISVLGSGIVLAQPNVAHITLGVEVFDPSLSTAQAQAAQRMDAVIGRLKAHGLTDDDIRTVAYNITPQYDTGRDPSSTVLRGYTVQNLVDARVTNVNDLGPIIDDVVAAGASRVYGISFESDNMAALKAQARDQAMADARAKAEQLARGAGVSVGRPLAIQESDTGGVTPVRQQAVPAAAASAAAPPTPIQPGELQVQTTVRVVFAIQ